MRKMGGLMHRLIGDTLRREREARRLSVNEVAEAASMRPSVVRAVERGSDSEVSVVTIARIAAAIGLSASEVIRKALDRSEPTL